jgi:hypothetical protein
MLSQLIVADLKGPDVGQPILAAGRIARPTVIVNSYERLDTRSYYRYAIDEFAAFGASGTTMSWLSDQVYFLTASSMPGPAFARSAGDMAG